MSYDDFRKIAFEPVTAINIDDLLDASCVGVLNKNAPGGPRARRRQARRFANKTGLLAPLLAAEGCLSLGKKDVSLGPEPKKDDIPRPDNNDGAQGLDNAGNSGSGGSGLSDNAGAPDVQQTSAGLIAQDDQFQIEDGASLEVSASDLLSNDFNGSNGSLELIRVFGAENGSVTLNGGIVTFTPDAGFNGEARFSYEVRDEDGSVSEAVVVVEIAGADGHDDGAGGGDSTHVHPTDAAKATEHVAVFDLVPVADATHIAVNSGSWFDPNTWANGEVPPDGAKVVVPEGITVQYDGESPVSLFTVRVDGALEFATDINTFMEVDTLIVSSTGTLTIGTVGDPVAQGVEAVIQIADNGPIDVAWDPLLLSRGVISHGTFEVHGAEKDNFLKVATDPMQGDTSLTLEEAPDGWEVGDKLVLTGTHLEEVQWQRSGSQQPDVGTEDEELIITAINGNVITFDRPLEYDHDTPRADLKAYVANYSRNVRFQTENFEDIPVFQRGHVMLMHSDDIDVRYAEFLELGRTDKSERAFDVTELDTVESDSNIKTRYSLHIHRAGVDNQDDPAMLVGNAVWGSPGWGFVQHDSNAVLADNAAYNVFGSAFVAETGNETGRWTHNIAIKSIGVRGGGDLSNPKVADDVAAFDLGRTGAGFWLQSRIVDVVDNVAAGVPSGQGFIYFTRGPRDDIINVLSENLPQTESQRYLDDVRIFQPTISSFEGNEAIAVNVGFMVVKENFQQYNDLRSVVEDFTAWETTFGIHIEYSANYTLLNVDLIGADHGETGITFGKNSLDNTINGANVVGFDSGVNLIKTFSFAPDGYDGDFGIVLIDVNIADAINDYVNLDSGDLVLSGADLVEGRLTFDPDIPELAFLERGRGLTLSGTKIDSIGAAPVSSDLDTHTYDWRSVLGAVQEEGYWTTQDGRTVTVFDQYISDRATGELIKVSNFVEYFDRRYSDDPDGTELDGLVYNGVLDLDSRAPVAVDDAVTVGENGSIVIDVLANDFDPDGDPLAVDGIDHPSHGRIDVNDDGTLTYTPDPNYIGSDEFWYWVEDDNGNFDKASVQVTVEA